jgi:hypothetical protein
MELDLQSLFGFLCTTVNCSHWLRPHNSPSHLGSYTRALLVSKDRRHLFVTPCPRSSCSNMFGRTCRNFPCAGKVATNDTGNPYCAVVFFGHGMPFIYIFFHITLLCTSMLLRHSWMVARYVSFLWFAYVFFNLINTLALHRQYLYFLGRYFAALYLPYSTYFLYGTCYY